jgi:hypothetical protein
MLSQFLLFFPMAQQPLIGHGVLIIEASLLHSDTSHSVRILWTSDQPDAETSTWQHTPLTRDRQPCSWRDSIPKSQQSERRQTRTLDCAATRISFCYYSPNKCRRIILIQCYTTAVGKKTNKVGMGNVIGFLQRLIFFFWLQLVLLHFLVHQA